ncbi:MAG: hypothetical protein F6K16_37580 [Symploca sp. SIO2B6]|nr:hypothetical protein [Symploca sp. SIO2B6]
MDLPLVFDIALGLMFIYLILSLLASEVQELMTTLLQWRAEHLKKSIEILVIGDCTDNPEGANFVNRLYKSPLLKSLNQEAKGPVAQFFRAIAQRIGESYRWITRTRNTFGVEKSGPSYIPSEAFVTALLEDLDIKAIIHQKSGEVLDRVVDEKLDLIRIFLDGLRQKMDDDTLLIGEFEDLRYRLDLVYKDFSHHQISFKNAMDQIINQCESFLANTKDTLGDDERSQYFIHSRLPYLNQSIAQRKLEPTIGDVIQSTVENHQNIPPHLKQNLVTLAKNTQAQAIELADEFKRFEQSLTQWFDRAMDRSSGVYKRNAKGVAFVLGFIIAVASNADTLYMINRLSTDSVLRTSIAQSADELVVQQGQFNPDADETDDVSDVGETVENVTTQQIQEVKEAMEVALKDLPLPIGWKAEVVAQQKEQEQASGWQFPILRRLIGWLISGVALSMGASFWYNLIGRVIRVRNTGSTTTKATGG